MNRRITVYKVVFTFLVFAILWIIVSPFIAKNLIIEKPLKNADAILVLSGSSSYVERTHHAAASFKKGIGDRVYLTNDGEFAGWSRYEERNPPFVQLAKKELIAQGVPEERIEILSPNVTGTIYEARILKAKAARENLKSILLVTSPYHTKRAHWTFVRVIADKNVKIGIISPSTGEQTPPPGSWWLSLRGWRVVAAEYVKFIVYWLFY